MNILAVDLGKFKSVACQYDTLTMKHQFTTFLTSPSVLHDLFVERQPDRVVIEIGSQAGWIKDLCEALELPLQIANANHEAWRWKNTKRKTDRDDALKLAQLSERKRCQREKGEKKVSGTVFLFLGSSASLEC